MEINIMNIRAVNGILQKFHNLLGPSLLKAPTSAFTLENILWNWKLGYLPTKLITMKLSQNLVDSSSEYGTFTLW